MPHKLSVLVATGNLTAPERPGPGRTLTGESLIKAIAALRPAKKHEKRYPRGDEPCLFDKCRRAGQKQPIDDMARSGLFEDDEMYRQWDKIDKEPNVSPLAGDDYEIEMPEGPITMIEICPGWSVNSVSAAKLGLIRNAMEAA